MEFPSGQRGQTVNLLATLSVVRIHSPPPNLTLYDDKTNVYQFLTCGCSSVVEPRPSKPVARVRSPSPAPDDPLAQSAEHLTFNQGVPRSSRGWVTNVGEVSERFKELVLKISDSVMGRGFESHPLRQENMEKYSSG